MPEDEHFEELKERLDQFEQHKEQRKGQGIMGREELIALCAAHIYAESFVNKLGLATSQSAWNAVKMAAEIVDHSFTYDDLERYKLQGALDQIAKTETLKYCYDVGEPFVKGTNVRVGRHVEFGPQSVDDRVCDLVRNDVVGERHVKIVWPGRLSPGASLLARK